MDYELDNIFTQKPHEQLRLLAEYALRNDVSVENKHIAEKALSILNNYISDPVMGNWLHGNIDKAVQSLYILGDEDRLLHASQLAGVAACQGDLRILNKISNTKLFDVASMKLNGEYIAMYSVDHPSCLNFFLDQGFDPNKTWAVDGNEPTSLLCEACCSDSEQIESVSLLLERGASPFVGSFEGSLPLRLACEKEYCNIVALIVSKYPSAVPSGYSAQVFRCFAKGVVRLYVESEDKLRQKIEEHDRFIKHDMFHYITCLQEHVSTKSCVKS